ncbi:MAG: lycopene cyclase domain-containing protein [Anaerolineales bacterium]
MTYFAFLLYFLFIPIGIILVITYFDNRANRPTPGFDARKVPLIIGVHVLLALTYTTPWDNYLVATGVWYYNPALVTGLTIGYVPIEEYTFFVVETVLTGLWWWFLARRIAPPAGEFKPSMQGRLIAFGALFVAWIFFTWQFFFGPEAWNYLGIIFFWALPAIFPQFLFGADLLWHYRKLVFWTIVPMGTYLSLMDIVALTNTTWNISKDQTLGINFFGILPIEEVAFFFITNVLIGFGMTLMLSNHGWDRFNAWRARGYKGLP